MMRLAIRHEGISALASARSLSAPQRRRQVDPMRTMRLVHDDG
jgi:hypothetical protein